jgi:SAM-dependent methyltransferase
LAEFTGERLIPGEVDVDLLNEHMARYAFAARLAHGKRVLDAGCGAGYGSAELAAQANSVTGADVAAEAVDFARAHYALPNLAFEQASCDRLPHADGCFDLVVAFEVIEHLETWREFLLEARRVLSPGGQLVVSTPNKLYYTESRGAEGANPFHVHEFDFAEFRGALEDVFPHVTLFLENHVEGVTFQPHRPGDTVETRVDRGDAVPDESHFFLAVCAQGMQIGNPTFVYVPRAGNVLRERERHIGLLDGELAQKDEWLEKSQRDLAEFERQHSKLLHDLEQSNQWADTLNEEVAERRKRVDELQRELAREQENAQAQILEVEEELARQQEIAQAQIRQLEQELARQQEAAQAQIAATERELAGAQANAQAQVQRVEEELAREQANAQAQIDQFERELAAEQATAQTQIQRVEEELARGQASAQAQIQRVEEELALQQAGAQAQIHRLEEELAREQANAQAQVSRLEAELAEKIEWARGIDAALVKEIAEKKRAVDLLHAAEADLADRTDWAQRLNGEMAGLREELSRVSGQLALYEASRWVKLGRRVRLGPGSSTS